MTQIEIRPIGRRKTGGRSRLLAAVLGCFGALSLGTGCGVEWHADSQSYLVPYEQGDIKTASEAALHCAHAKAGKDDLLFNLDAGALLRVDGNLGESTSRFDYADSLVGDYQQWPDMRLSEETTAAVTSARVVVYRGSLSDLVMLNTYRALNHMELGENNGARAMLIRAGFVQQDIAQKYEADLRKAQDETAKDAKDNSDQFDTNKTLAASQDQTKDDYKDVLNLKAYADFVNPYCDYIQGLFFLGAGLDQSDRERAAAAFKRASSMEKENPYILQDIAAAESVANGHELQPVTYVLFETGTAPELGQVQVPLPLFLANNQAPTVVLYFPTIKPRGPFVQSLDLQTAAGAMQTSVVSDMDAVVIQEFKNNLSNVISRMVIAAAAKAAVDAGIRQGLKGQNGLVQVGFSVLSTGYQLATNQADLRCWRTLPKQFQVARFPTPADHHLSISPHDRSGTVQVDLSDAPVNVVYVKSVRSGVPLIVRKFVLSPKDRPAPATPPMQAPAPVALAH